MSFTTYLEVRCMTIAQRSGAGGNGGILPQGSYTVHHVV